MCTSDLTTHVCADSIPLLFISLKFVHVSAFFNSLILLKNKKNCGDGTTLNTEQEKQWANQNVSQTEFTYTYHHHHGATVNHA